MSFPFHAIDRHRANSGRDYRAMLADAVARQANSRTGRAMRQLLRQQAASESAINQACDQRIHYFAAHGEEEMAPSGAFWAILNGKDGAAGHDEIAVYQDDSVNFKDRELEQDGTGEWSNHAGHEISRMI